MPKIPEYQPQMSTILDKNPPGVSINPGEFGMPDEALGRLGNQMTQFGTEMMQRQQQAQDTNTAQNQVHQDMIDFNDFQQKLKVQMPDDYQGYTSSIQGWIKNRQDQVKAQGGMTDRAWNLYQGQAGGFYAHQVVQAQDDEMKNRTQSYVTDLTNNIEESGNALVNNPSQETAYDLYHQHTLQIDSMVGNVISADDGAKLRAQAQGTVASAYFNGLYAKGIGDPRNGNTFLKQGLAALAGKTNLDQGAGDDALFKGLSPDQQAAQIDRFERAIKTNHEIRSTHLNAQLGDYIAAVQNGMPGDPQILSNVRQAIATGSIQPEDGARIFAKVSGAQAVANLSQQLRSTPASQWDQVFQNLDNQMAATTQSLQKQFPGVAAVQGSNFGVKNLMDAKADLASAAYDIEQQRKKDPAQAVMDNFPAVATQVAAAGNDPGKTRDAIAAVLSTQRAMGMPEKILTTQDEGKMVQGFKTASPQQQATQLDFYQQKYGDNWGRVMGELSGGGKIDPHLWAASLMPDSSARIQMLTNLEKQKDITTGFKDQYGDENGTNAKQLNAAVRTKMAPYYAAMTGGSQDPAAADRPNALSNFVTLEAKRLMVNQGIKNPDEAASQAAAQIQRNFTPIRAGNSNVMIPNQGNRPEIIRGFMEGNLSSEGIRDLNPMVAPGTDPQDLKKYGRWVNTSGNTLTLRSARPGLPPAVVRGQDGNPIQFDLGDISNHKIPGSLYQRAVDQANKGMARRLWDKVGMN